MATSQRAGERRSQPERLADPSEGEAPSADLTEQDSAEAMQQDIERAARAAEKSDGLGTPGRPLDRRSPFFIGMAAAAGVAVTYGIAELVIRARSVLVLIGLALFVAAGLDPAVSWLTRRRLPRWAAVLTVVAVTFGVLAAFLAAAVPPLATQAAALASHLPHYLHALNNPNSELGRLNLRYHAEKRLQQALASHGTSIAGGLLGAGEVVLSTATSIFVVLVLTLYFLAGLPRIKLFMYRLAPRSRRPRVILIGDEIFTKVGGYLLGNFLTSLVAGVGTYLWMLAFGIPYPALLGLMVALFDLIPVIGSTIGGVIVSLVALTVSLPVALGTAGFYVAYRFAEDYLLVPRVMGKTVQVPAALTVVAVLIGATLLGLIGALVAIPAAAAIRLLVHEVTFRRMDTT
jgi:predicted PurR-regulated permease PerM